MSPLERLFELRPVVWAIDTGERLRAKTAPHVLELTVRRFLADGMVDRGASLAYYGLLSLLPVLMIVAGVISLLAGEDTAVDFGGYVRDQGGSATLAETAESVMQTAIDSGPSSASTVGLVGLATLIYGASRAFAAAGRSLDVIWRRKQKVLTIFRRAQGIGWTLVLLVLGLIAGLLTFVGRGLLEDLFDLVGLSNVSTPLWTILRWPLAAILMMLSMRLVMWAAPSPPRERFRIFSPGAAMAAGIWLAASAGYGFYVGELSAYNATYGSFAALVILMLWIWLTSMAFLFGCEFDAVLVERREEREATEVSATGAASPRRVGAPQRPPGEPAAPPPERTRAEGR